jgi:hypothetical protein
MLEAESEAGDEETAGAADDGADAADDTGVGVFAQPLHPAMPTLNTRANAMSTRIVLFKLDSPSLS